MLEALYSDDRNWVGMTEAAGEFRLVDLFHETVGEPASHQVIAGSIAEVLEGLIETREMYWLDGSFQPLGRI